MNLNSLNSSYTQSESEHTNNNSLKLELAQLETLLQQLNITNESLEKELNQLESEERSLRSTNAELSKNLTTETLKQRALLSKQENTLSKLEKTNESLRNRLERSMKPKPSLRLLAPLSAQENDVNLMLKSKRLNQKSKKLKQELAQLSRENKGLEEVLKGLKEVLRSVNSTNAVLEQELEQLETLYTTNRNNKS